MALTYTADPPQLVGNKRVVRGTVTFDSSYLTAGEAFTPGNVGLTALELLIVSPALGSATPAYVPVWNRSVSSPTIRLFEGDNNNAADAPLIEVTSTTNVSAVVVDYEAYGY